MSSKKKGVLFLDSEWHKHLRPYGKRVFWKGNRRQEALQMGVRSEPPASGPIEGELESIMAHLSRLEGNGEHFLWIPIRVLDGGEELDHASAIDLIKEHASRHGWSVRLETAELDGTMLAIGEA